MNAPEVKPNPAVRNVTISIHQDEELKFQKDFNLCAGDTVEVSHNNQIGKTVFYRATYGPEGLGPNEVE